jgi:predicted TIM-barrel fold metal-dependent hydrolase
MSESRARELLKAPVSGFVDSHFHLWDLDENYYPWLSDGDRPTLVKNAHLLRRNYKIEDYLRDVADLPIIGAVHVQAEHDQRDPVRETRWLQNVADGSGSRGLPNGIVVFADLADERVEQTLAEHCAFRNVRGLRQALHRYLERSYDPLEDPRWVANFHLLERYRLAFDLQLFLIQADGALALVDAHPGITFILTHAAMLVPLDAEGFALWQRTVQAFARRPNVYIKLSGFGGVGEHWDAKSIDPVISEAISAFTPARCMLASNFPVEGLNKPYQDIWKIYFEYFDGFTETEREQVFWRTANQAYRLGI